MIDPYNDPYRYDEIIEESLNYEQDNSKEEIMDTERTELLDSMVDGTCQDILYQFNLDNDAQAIRLIRESLDRLEADNKSKDT